MPVVPQPALFDDDAFARPARHLPVIGEQKDISYYGTTARGILNGPATTGMDFWSINPYVGCAFGCAYCYARYAHRYTLERASHVDPDDEKLRDDLAELPPWLAFERRIFVKQNAADLLRRALRHYGDRYRALCAQGVVIGTATDPYQPAERRFRVTRGVLEVLAEHGGVGVSIITKSPLITRDVELLERIARQSRLTVHLTITTMDRELARRIEPRAPTPEARLRALSRLRGAGIDVGVNVMPILPGITDDPEGLDLLVRQVAAAGATHVAACALRLRATARERYIPFIEAEFPELAQRYRRSYARSHQVSARYREGLHQFVERLCEKYGVRFGYGRALEEPTPVLDRTSAADAPAQQLALAL